MNMKARHFLLTTIMAMTTLQVFASENPEITTTILNCLEGEAVPAGICAVSNVKRIEAKIVLDRKGNANLPPFAEAAINPGPPDSPDQFIVVKATESSSGAAVPIKSVAYEKTAEDGKEVVKITIEILEENNVRQNKIQTYVDQVRTQQAAVPGAESQKLVDEMIAKNADIVSAIEKLYIENRTGNYTLVVEYHSTHAGSWVGQVTSSPITVEVLNKGSFFDSLQTP
jgi:hypothetical protein